MADNAPQKTSQKSLGASTKKGSLQYIAETLAGKAIGMLAQIALAYLLLEEDFGLFAMAMTVASFTALLSEMGLQQVLVQKSREFNKWAGPVFWLSILTGIISATSLVLLAPHVARFYDAPILETMLYIMSVSTLIGPIGAVARAKLQTDMRFGALAATSLFVTSGSLLITVSLAVTGWGALSFVLPLPFVRCGAVATLWIIARPKFSPKFVFKLWPKILGASGLLLCSQLCFTITFQGDKIVLGRYYEEAVVGLYFFAFNLSAQWMTMFVARLQNVLFPALNRLEGDRDRQMAAFKRITSVMAVVGIPLCFTQAAIAEPLIRLIFPERWYPAIPVFQILSIATGLRIAGTAGASMILAQGRYGARFALSLAVATLYLTGVILTAPLGLTAVAIAVALSYAVTSVSAMKIAARDALSLAEILNLYLRPMLLGIAMATPAYLICSDWLVGDDLGKWLDLPKLLLALCVSGGLLVVLGPRLDPNAYREVTEQFVNPLLRRVMAVVRRSGH